MYSGRSPFKGYAACEPPEEYAENDGDDSDEWTTIAPKGKGKKKSPSLPTRRTGPDEDLTLKDLQREYEKHLKVWRQSTCRKGLLRIFEQRRSLSSANCGIDTVVCLATGSFSTLNLEANKRAMLQFVCAVDTTRELGRGSGSEDVRVYAQEPNYSAVDREFCASLGVTVLDAATGDLGLGQATALLGPQTLLFEFFMDMGRQGLEELMASNNGVYIGSSVLRHAKTDKGLVERFQRGCASRWFPEFEEDGNVFRGLMCYWKQDGEDDEEGDGGGVG